MALAAFARLTLVSAGALALSGCALPPVVSVASFALDVASYSQSGKSVTDHGLSLVLRRDCAVLNLFDGYLCQQRSAPGEASTALAALRPLGDPGMGITGRRAPAAARNGNPFPGLGGYLADDQLAVRGGDSVSES